VFRSKSFSPKSFSPKSWRMDGVVPPVPPTLGGGRQAPWKPRRDLRRPPRNDDEELLILLLL